MSPDDLQAVLEKAEAVLAEMTVAIGELRAQQQKHEQLAALAAIPSEVWMACQPSGLV